MFKNNGDKERLCVKNDVIKNHCIKPFNNCPTCAAPLSPIFLLNLSARINMILYEYFISKGRFHQIYFCFCTSGIASYIIRCAILPFDCITSSCHRGLYIDLNLTIFLQNPTISTVSCESRIL